METKVLLASIAKDEAPYLPEWVYHHLSIGFSGVWIYINNTSDKTWDIVNKINDKCPQVKGVNADKIIKIRKEEWSNFLRKSFEENNPLQSRAFVDIFLKAREEGYTHVAFFDVDELLYIDNFSVGDYIENVRAQYGSADILKFKWFQCDGDEKEFSPGIIEEVTGRKTVQTKYILSTSLTDFLFVSTHHVISLKEHHSAHLPGVGMLQPNETHKKHKVWSNEAFILHRYLRSRQEYLAKLLSGDNVASSVSSIGIKLTRPGWLSIKKDAINFDVRYVEKWQLGYEEFVEKCCIHEELFKSKLLVYENAEKAKELYFDFYNDALRISRVMRGTGLPVLEAKV